MNFTDLIKLYNSNSLTEAEVDRLEYEQAKEEWFGKKGFKAQEKEEIIDVRKPNKDYR